MAEEALGIRPVKKMTLYVLTDETGVVVRYCVTKRELRAEMKDWQSMGTEPGWHTVNYIPTRAGVANLLNSLTSEP